MQQSVAMGVLTPVEGGEVAGSAGRVEPFEGRGPPVEGVPPAGVARSPESDSGCSPRYQRDRCQAGLGEEGLDG